MQIVEFAKNDYIKGKRFTVGVVFVAEDSNTFGKHLEELKAGVDEWRKKRKLSADSIAITIMTNEANFTEVKTYFETEIQAEEHSSIFGQLPITISFLDDSKLLAEVNIRGGIKALKPNP